MTFLETLLYIKKIISPGMLCGLLKMSICFPYDGYVCAGRYILSALKIRMHK
jgi:hypothetical protein